jgi:Flp pilus assembly pilin Flp
MFLRKFRQDQSGSAAVEYGLTVPILAALVGGLFEVTRVLFVSTLLEWSMTDAARFGTTGNEDPTLSREEVILQIIEDRTFGMVSMNDAVINTLIYPSFDTIGTGEEFTDVNGNGAFDAGEPFDDLNLNGTHDADIGVPGVGGPSDVVLYNVTYDLPPISPFIEHIFGTVTLSSSATVRNEPY